MTGQPAIRQARTAFHASLMKSILHVDSHGIPANADRDSPASVKIARGIAEQIGSALKKSRLAGQTSGNKFEEICAAFVERNFLKLGHLRPGKWNVGRPGGRNRLEIARYEQYFHLTALDAAAKKDAEVAVALGSDYIITPDILISRDPEHDEVINNPENLVDESVARLSGLRLKNNQLPILHASISCKWTVRSDRAQNARSEALNLVRNRKGRLPHIVVITGEPLPSRIASLALGTGDIDCVYHFALQEMMQAAEENELDDASELLRIMINGKRLRDIGDLPLDLAV
ncbi:restriction endonuclease [Candidatus Sumerlaeota bacterium]|nr:restriction endonuclease [Candidatus Sumerlaeota bacterium]MBI3736268.1 restriction endonuclease [Candidatus Sumerlaeota bacterium]